MSIGEQKEISHRHLQQPAQPRYPARARLFSRHRIPPQQRQAKRTHLRQLPPKLTLGGFGRQRSEEVGQLHPAAQDLAGAATTGAGFLGRPPFAPLARAAAAFASVVARPPRRPASAFHDDMRRRSAIERIIACLVRYHGARHATGYGLANADYQAHMAAMAFNLKTWATLTNQRRRPKRTQPHDDSG